MNTFVHLKKIPLDTLSQNKVLKANDYLAHSTAQEIIRTAEAKAQAMLRRAEEVYAAEKNKGYQDGIQASKAELSEQITETAIKSVDYLENVEKDLVNLVMKAIQKIIGEFDDEALTGKVVSNALRLFQNQHRLTLRVAPSLQSDLETKRDTDFQAIPHLDIVADPQLAPKNCILESEVGMVDASIETQLKAIESALIKHAQES
jgi:type III secretion protein L